MAKTRKTNEETPQEGAGQKPAALKTPTAPPDPAESQVGEAPDERPMLSSREAFEKHLAAALALPEDDVPDGRGVDTALMYHNLKRGTDNVVIEANRAIIEKLPGVRFDELAALPTVAQGLLYADLQVVPARSNGRIAMLFEEGFPLRLRLIAAADSYALGGKLPREVVDDIKKGRGKPDAARDLTRVGGLFLAHPHLLDGASPVSRKDAVRAEEIGSELETLLTPANAPRTRNVPEATRDSLDRRNRFIALVKQGWGTLWRVGAFIHGPDLVDEMVPPLMSRHVAARPDSTDDGKGTADDSPPK